MFPYCKKDQLKWKSRREILLKEIQILNSDIICLQEVVTEQFNSYFLPQLQLEGYDGIFSPKSRAKTMSENERKHVDGCAIFYKTNNFNLFILAKE